MGQRTGCLHQSRATSTVEYDVALITQGSKFIALRSSTRYCLCVQIGIFCIYVIFCILCILFILIFPARIDDGDDVDDWEVTDHRTGNRVPLRADRWYQRAPQADPIITNSDFAGIRINLWNRAMVRRFMTHSLAGGGSHNLGHHALRWEMILHGNAGEMGKYAVLSVLPDKIARFLYEYHDTSYTLLGLPAIPMDRSKKSVHGILRPDQVKQI